MAEVYDQIELYNPLESYYNYKISDDIEDYMKRGFYRYEGKTVSYDIKVVYREPLHLAVDVPVMIRSANPISKEKNPIVAIVGEAPGRWTRDMMYPSISIGMTFGQHDPKYKVNPRTYDMVADWYLSRGFDVYMTNLSKWTRYQMAEGNPQIKKTIESDNQIIIDILKKEFREFKLNHIIWLGDQQWKRFVYGEAAKDFFTDWTVFPHPSGANNNAWVKKLRGKPCTEENKVEYIVRNANVLYLKDGKMRSTIDDIQS